MGDSQPVSAYISPTMIAVFLKPPLRYQPAVYQMAGFPKTPEGTWYPIRRPQAWHRLELLHGGLVLLKLESGVTVSGTVEWLESDKCVFCLFMNPNGHQPVRIGGSWCLWHGVLDFHFLGEYLLFKQR